METNYIISDDMRKQVKKVNNMLINELGYIDEFVRVVLDFFNEYVDKIYMIKQFFHISEINSVLDNKHSLEILLDYLNNNENKTYGAFYVCENENTYILNDDELKEWCKSFSLKDDELLEFNYRLMSLYMDCNRFDEEC